MDVKRLEEKKVQDDFRFKTFMDAQSVAYLKWLTNGPADKFVELSEHEADTASNN